MIVKMKYVNPINNNEEELIVKYPNVDYIFWRSIISYNNDNDIANILNSLLKELDCTREYSCGRPCMTKQFNYSDNIYKYYYYLIKFNNQLLYNNYVDKLIKRHIDNIVFEYENPYIPKSIKSKANKRNKLAPNKFERLVTRDIFNGETIYVYENIRTKERIESTNPNLLEELNNPKKKKVVKDKKVKIDIRKGAVPISAMTFSFKKK